MNKQHFREDTTGTLVFYPPEHAQPDNDSTAKVTLCKPSGDELQAEDDATVDTVSTTLSSASSYGDHRISVSSATGIVAGRKYVIEENGLAVIVKVKDVSGTTVTISQRLPEKFCTSATFKGYALLYSLTATHTADKNDSYLARWQYNISSATYYADTTFDVVASVDWFPTTVDSLFARYPRLERLMEEDDKDGTELLRTTWDNKMVPMLRSKGMLPERVRSKENLVPLHIAMANELHAENEAMEDQDRNDAYELARGETDRVANMVFAVLDWYDADDDLQADSGEEHQNFSSVMVSR